MAQKWRRFDDRLVKLQNYLTDRYKGIYGSVTISYEVVTLPSLTLNKEGVYNKADILKITKPYHTKYDAVGVVFPYNGEKYAGNYYPNTGDGEYKMDFYIKANEQGRSFEEYVEHEMAHAVALDLGLTGQGTNLGFVTGADNTHYYFYGKNKDGFYKEVQAQWKKKSSVLMQMLQASSKLLEQLIGKKKIDKPVNDLLPEVKEKMERLIKICELMDMPIRVTSGFRSVEEQNKLYAQGRTTSGKIVTNAKGGQSMHNYGIAFDYCFNTGVAFPPSQSERWNKVNRIAQLLGFYSYGLSEKWDDGHLQLMLGYSEKDFRENKVDYSKFS